MEPSKSIVLPTSFLSHQKCEQCFNYLSVGPIVLRPGGKKICGRCTLENELVFYSLYNKIAECCFFKCKNHYSGCKKIEGFNSDHEQTCEDYRFSCLLCSFQGNGCQLTFHLDKFHQQNKMVNYTFKVKIKEGLENTFFDYRQDYLLVIKVFIKNDMLHLGAFNICENADIRKCTISLFQLGNKFTFLIENVEVLSVNDKNRLYKLDLIEICDVFNWTNWVYGKITISNDKNFEEIEMSLIKRRLQIEYQESELIKKENNIRDRNTELVDQEKELSLKLIILSKSESMAWLKKFASITCPALLTCSACSLTLSEEIYLCPKNHSFCDMCLSGKCNKCGTLCQWSSGKEILERIIVTCDWENCNGASNLQTYLTHKQRCSFRRYKCPVMQCNYEGTAENLIVHWHIPEPVLRTEEQPHIVFKGDCEFYWLIEHNRELVHVKMLTREKNDISAKVNLKIIVYEDQVVFSENFDIELHVNKLGYYVYVTTLKRHGTTKTETIRTYLNTIYKLIVISK